MAETKFCSTIWLRISTPKQLQSWQPLHSLTAGVYAQFGRGCWLHLPRSNFTYWSFVLLEKNGFAIKKTFIAIAFFITTWPLRIREITLERSNTQQSNSYGWETTWGCPQLIVGDDFWSATTPRQNSKHEKRSCIVAIPSDDGSLADEFFLRASASNTSLGIWSSVQEEWLGATRASNKGGAIDDIDEELADLYTVSASRPIPLALIGMGGPPNVRADALVF